MKRIDSIEVRGAVIVKRMLKDLKRKCSFCWVNGMNKGMKHL
jgi:hypothetical protein